MGLLIAGFGELGQSVAAICGKTNERVIGLCRSQREVSALEIVQADLLAPESYQGRLRDVQRLVYCPTPSQRDADGYRGIFVTGLAQLLATARLERWPLRRVVLVSSTAVYADDGSDYTESSPTQPRDFNGHILLEAERVALASNVSSAVVRLGGIYGPGRLWLLRRALAEHAEGSARWTNRIHIDDAAAIVHHALHSDWPTPIYNGVDLCPAREFEIMNWMRQQRDLPPVRQSGAELGKRVLPDALRAQGFRWRYPDFRAGYQALL